MTKKLRKFNTELSLIEDSADESFASISLNPNIQWAKIVVTDDKPNANKERIPKEEFENLIATGINSPVKMSELEEKDHASARGKAIGTIAKMTSEQNYVIALAALWKKEREGDIKILKDMYEKGVPPNVSWELSYSEGKEEEGGVLALYDVSLDGLAIVDNPAYKGRTPFIAMSEKKEDASVEELEKANTKISELEQKLKQLEDTRKTEAEKQKTEVEKLESELKDLRKFKADVEAKEQEEANLAEIVDKFKEAGIEKEEDYFSDNRELLLGLEENALDFMLQELATFSEEDPEESLAEDEKLKVPRIERKKTKTFKPKELGEALRKAELEK